MEKNKIQRRKFLSNLGWAAAGVTLVPLLGKSSALAAPLSPAPAGNCMPTTLDYYGEGPFYTSNAPTISNSNLAGANEPGSPLTISGRAMNLDCTEVIPNTILDIWHADDAGAYDNSGFNLRGVTTTNAQGFYLFNTILPGKYLNGNQFRPSHIHFKITTPGYPELTTQLYFEGDTSIPNDAAASITSGQYDATSRIIPLTLTNGAYEGTWDVVVDGDGVTVGQEALHLNKGMLYSSGPNPFTDTLEIRYGVFREAKVSINVYNVNGQKVATLEENEHSPEKYTAVWQPEPSLPKGHYFIALMWNDLQVHYLKVVRQ